MHRIGHTRTIGQGEVSGLNQGELRGQYRSLSGRVLHWIGRGFGCIQDP